MSDRTGGAFRSVWDGPGVVPPGARTSYKSMVNLVEGLTRKGVRLGLRPLKEVLSRLDHPERGRPAIHVAGSNGKGSTSAFLASILSAHGYRVGLFTSPHLTMLTERVQVVHGGRSVAVTPEAFLEALQRVEAVAPGFEALTFFEVVTAAGLDVLRRADVDVMVVEAGLGARLDATRLVEAEIAVLTDLCLEHTEFLGDTLEEIAAEEGAVVRPGRPLVTAGGPPEAMAVVEGLARAHSATLFRLGQEISFKMGAEGQANLDLGDRVLPDASLSLLGPHQWRNAALAAKAACLLEPSIEDRALYRGLATAHWPGRMETICRPGRPMILLDGAHNAQAAGALAEAVASDRGRFSGPMHLVFGVLADKNGGEMLSHLLPLAASVALTRPDSHRALEPERIPIHGAGLFLGVDPGLCGEIQVIRSVPRAFAAAEARAAKDGGWVLVAGSLYLVGAVRDLLTR